MIEKLPAVECNQGVIVWHATIICMFGFAAAMSTAGISFVAGHAVETWASYVVVALLNLMLVLGIVVVIVALKTLSRPKTKSRSQSFQHDWQEYEHTMQQLNQIDDEVSNTLSNLEKRIQDRDQLLEASVQLLQSQVETLEDREQGRVIAQIEKMKKASNLSAEQQMLIAKAINIKADTYKKDE